MYTTDGQIRYVPQLEFCAKYKSMGGAGVSSILEIHEAGRCALEDHDRPLYYSSTPPPTDNIKADETDDQAVAGTFGSLQSISGKESRRSSMRARTGSVQLAGAIAQADSGTNCQLVGQQLYNTNCAL